MQQLRQGTKLQSIVKSIISWYFPNYPSLQRMAHKQQTECLLLKRLHCRKPIIDPGKNTGDIYGWPRKCERRKTVDKIS